MTIKFYDTSAILAKEKFYPEEEKYALSVITLQELENIKTSNSADEDVKYRARRFLRYLDEHSDDFEIVCDYDKNLKTNDEKILSSAYNYLQDKAFYFITNDLSMKFLAINAWHFNKDFVIAEKPILDNYTGYVDVIMDD